MRRTPKIVRLSRSAMIARQQQRQADAWCLIYLAIMLALTISILIVGMARLQIIDSPKNQARLPQSSTIEINLPECDKAGLTDLIRGTIN
jgi:hypothetical protein